MNRALPLLIPLLCGLTSSGNGQTPGAIALKNEIQQSINKGIAFLSAKQNEEGGFWVTPDEPALSALALSALSGDPSRERGAEESAPISKGFDYLLKNVKPDGGIYGKARANYNTSISLTALVQRGRRQDEQVILNARKFVVGSQIDSGDKGKTDGVFDGGIGYGEPKPGAPANADLSNMTFALEALYYSKQMFADTGMPVEKKDDLNWDAAIQFVERCQNLPNSNDQPWAGDDKKNLGAFVYTPANNPGEGKKKDGRVAMRYYGSISYAGMLSFIYAGLSPEDPRVKAAIQWLGENYTLDENPGMGAEGLFYYYHTMAKALSTADVTTLKTKTGSVDWRAPLSRKLISLQGADGSWRNAASGRWMESDPVLVTAYTVLALEQVHRSIK